MLEHLSSELNESAHADEETTDALREFAWGYDNNASTKQRVQLSVR